MILTICANPCVDCTIEIEDFSVGKLNRLDSKLENTSGKALNTAVGVSRLFGEAATTGFMFESGGARFIEFLNNENIKSSFVWVSGSVRVNYKIIDSKAMMTEINDKGDFVPQDKQLELLQLVNKLSKEASVVVLSGSLPQGVASDYYLKLIENIDSKAKVIVDVDGDRLKNALKSGRIDMIKPNMAELQNHFGKKISLISDIKYYANELIKEGTKSVMVSMGMNGAIYTDGNNTYYCRSESVAVNSTVGAGDSMVAAAALAIENGLSMEQTLKMAVAAGTASVTTFGTNLFTKEKYEEILQKLTVEKL